MEIRYERFERVDQGDFNWVSPNFLAFASPMSTQIQPVPITAPEYSKFPSCVPEIPRADISQPFQNVLTHFVQRDIGLVVRLNSELYCPTYFTALGIQHIDMIFEDGTCPALPVVKKFIRLAHNMIGKKKGIAVHCKAGLGRTGCLIGAYLIYRYGFTAGEVIAFMRFMRPGMVVGPQQHWLHLNQGQFREWYIEDQLKTRLELTKPATPKVAKTPMKHSQVVPTATPPNKSSAPRSALGEIDGNDAYVESYQDENLPAPTPGQPRKYARMDHHGHPYSRSTSGMTTSPDKASHPTGHHKVVDPSTADSDEEVILQRMAARRSTSKSPKHGKGRSVSHTITTTETVSIFEDDEQVYDEVVVAPMRISKTRSPSRRSGGEEKSKVRKTSGRVGSASQPRAVTMGGR